MHQNTHDIDTVKASFTEMLQRNVHLSGKTFSAVATASALASDTKFAWQAFLALRDRNVTGNLHAYGKLLNLFSASYEAHHAWDVFITMHASGVGTPKLYNDGIRYMANLRIFDQAHQGLYMMLSAGFLPKVGVFNKTLDGYVVLDRPHAVFAVFNLMLSAGVLPNASTYALVRRSLSRWAQRLDAMRDELARGSANVSPRLS